MYVYHIQASYRLIDIYIYISSSALLNKGADKFPLFGVLALQAKKFSSFKPRLKVRILALQATVFLRRVLIARGKKTIEETCRVVEVCIRKFSRRFLNSEFNNFYTFNTCSNNFNLYVSLPLYATSMLPIYTTLLR